MSIKSLLYRTRTKLRELFEQNLPTSIRYLIFSKLDGTMYEPPINKVYFGELRRLQPINKYWGFNRGLPIDRHYIEKFLKENSSHIKGKVLEIGDDYYTNKFGGEHVAKSDVLNIVKEVHESTTIVADLASSPEIPSNSFDCIIFTQTLMLIYDMHSAIATLYRILKPGGVILATLGGISRTDDYNFWERNWCWHFTSLSAEKIFKEKFPPNNVFIQGYGNVLTAISFLHGLGAKDLTQKELDFYDNKYEILIAIKAKKPE